MQLAISLLKTFLFQLCCFYAMSDKLEQTPKMNERLTGSPRPTVKSVARMTGFSIATVSKALSGSSVVTAKTQTVIRAAAIKVGYRADLRGVMLRTGKAYQIAVLMPVVATKGFEWDGVEYTQILSGISQAIEDSPYRLAVHTIKDSQDSLRVAEQIVNQGLADGLIFSGIEVKDSRVAFLVKRDFPFVTMGRNVDHPNYAHVDIDNKWAAHAATTRLLNGGHRRIALINPEKRLAYAKDRISGYKEALATASVPFDQALIANGDLSTGFARAKTVELRHLQNPPTGFVCANESTTLGTLSGLASFGLVPGEGQVDVIAYDDINVSAYFNPPLTTFYFPIEKLGRDLGEFLLRRLGGEDVAALQRLFRPKLVARQSNRLF